MDIYSKKGSKVVFINKGGRDGDKEEASKILKEGETYTVKRTEVHGFISYVTLEEFPNEEFNTVMFEDYKGTMLPRGVELKKGKEFLGKLRIPEIGGSKDGVPFEFNKGTEHFVDNLDKGVSTFIRLPRCNYMTITNICYAAYILATTDKSIIINSRTIEDARLNIERLKNISVLNNLDIRYRIYMNMSDDNIKELLATGVSIGMIIYDNISTMDLIGRKMYHNILSTITSCIGDRESIKRELAEGEIQYIEYSYLEIGRTEEWFNEQCKYLCNNQEIINKELLLQYD